MLPVRAARRERSSRVTRSAVSSSSARVFTVRTASLPHGSPLSFVARVRDTPRRGRNSSEEPRRSSTGRQAGGRHCRTAGTADAVPHGGTADGRPVRHRRARAGRRVHHCRRADRRAGRAAGRRPRHRRPAVAARARQMSVHRLERVRRPRRALPVRRRVVHHNVSRPRRLQRATTDVIRTPPRCSAIATPPSGNSSVVNGHFIIQFIHSIRSP